MSSDDELRRLRRELDEVIDRTEELARRLGELEAQGGGGAPAEVYMAPEPVERPPVVPVAVFREKSVHIPEPSLGESAFQPQDNAPAVGSRFELDLWTLLSDGPIGKSVRARVEELRARTRDLGWEVLLGTYMLPRVAVACIAIAVVFFLTLAIERWGAAWMPHLRVGIGYVVAAALMAMAWRSEAKYGGLARVLYGGGFAVMYFVTFATHYVPFARVFPSPVPTLVLLTVVVAAWAVAAQLRQSKIIAVLVTALGHLTIFLAAVTLDQPGPFAMTGLVALGAGSAFFLLRNNWYYVAVLGLVGCYVNDFVVLGHGRAGDPRMDFAGAMGVLAAFFLIFALAELFSPENLRRRAIPGWFRNAFVTLNTAAFLALGSLLVGHYEFTRDHQDLFRFAFGALLLLIGLGYLRFRAGDPLFNVYVIKSVALVTLALATRYGGDVLSACLAVEMVVLLVSARQSGLLVMRLMALAVGCLAFIQSAGAAFHMAFGMDLLAAFDAAALNLETIAYTAPEYRGLAVRVMFGVAAFFVSSQLYQRTNWTLRSPASAPFSPATLGLLWQLDLIAERPATLEHLNKPWKGLLFPYLYTAAGTVLFLAYVFPLAQEGHRFALVAAFALMMTAFAAWLGSETFGFAGVVPIILVALPVGGSELRHVEALSLPVIMAGIAALFTVAFMTETSRVGKRAGLVFHQNAVSPYLLYGVSAWLTGLLLVREFPGFNGVFALAVAALIAAGLFLVLHPGAFAVLFGGFIFWAGMVFVPDVLNNPRGDYAVPALAAVLLAGLSLLADRFFTALGKRSPLVTSCLCAGLVVNALVIPLCFLEHHIPPAWLMVMTALGSYFFFGYAGAFHSPVAAAVAVAGAVYASCRHTARAFDAASLHPGLVVAFLLLAVFWIMSERRYAVLVSRHGGVLEAVARRWFIDPRRPETVLLPIGAAAALLLVLLERIPFLAPANLVFVTIGWFGLAAVLLLLSLPFHQRFYRYAGLAVILLSLGRLFLMDMKEQDPLLRVAAFAVVGAGLLGISVGYYKWMSRMRRAGPEDGGGDG